MIIFVDTSAILALINERDRDHESAQIAWEGFSQLGEILVSNNYVLVESLALLQNRLCMDAVALFQTDIVPCLQVEWVDAEQHTNAVNNVISANRRNLSLVDCASFETMRRLGIRVVFAFDPHFAEQGFDVLA